MSQYLLHPKPAYDGYRIVVGWDRPLGTYYAQVISINADEPQQTGRTATFTGVLHRLAALLRLPAHWLPARWLPAEPVFIWLGADGTPITHATDVIQAVAPYAHIPDNLGIALALDQLTEGSRRHRP